MSAGAVQLTVLRADARSGAPAPEDAAEQRAIRAKAEALLRERFDQERRQHQVRCAQCESQLNAYIRTMNEKIERQVLEIGLKIAEIVLRRQLPDRGMLESVIRETLHPISDLQGVKVRVSPAEAAGLKSPGGDGWPHFPLSEQVEVVVDSTLSAGDLVIESRNGVFDGRLNERLSLLSEKLAERMKNSDASHPPQSS